MPSVTLGYRISRSTVTCHAFVFAGGKEIRGGSCSPEVADEFILGLAVRRHSTAAELVQASATLFSHWPGCPVPWGGKGVRIEF